MTKQPMAHRYVAEFVGTFGIVFAPVALSASAHLAGGDSGLMAAAWVSGLAVLAMVYALGHISAAHFTPPSRSGSPSPVDFRGALSCRRCRSDADVLPDAGY